MPNMAYCRFENTLEDLRDCYRWLAENEPSDLSETELKAFRRMVKFCSSIAEDYSDFLPAKPDATP